MDFHQILHIRRYAGHNHLCKFWCEKLKGLGNTRGQILEFPTEMAGHPYNRAGATGQPVICTVLTWHIARLEAKDIHEQG